MDPYTLTMIIRTLLASAGLKMTLLILFVGGVLFIFYKAVKSAGVFFERMINNRDAMLDRLTRDITASEERRASHEKETASIMATMRADVASQLNEARDTRSEMHKRFNQSGLEHTEIKEKLAFIQGAKS